MKIYQIFVCVLILVTCCHAMPASLPVPEDSPTTAPLNLTETEKLPTITEAPSEGKNISDAKNATIESRSFPDLDLDPVIPFHADEFKVKVLDLDHPTNRKGSLNSEISIGLPTYHLQSPLIIKVPEFYELPRYIENADLISNYHYSTSDLADSFIPFQEVPSLTQDFSGNIFGISGSYPVYPIEFPQGADQYPIAGGIEQYPIIGGVGGISTIPILGEVPQEIEFLKPDEINTVGLTDEKVDHENDSITVDALKKLNATFEDFKQATKRNEEGDKEHKTNDKDNTK